MKNMATYHIVTLIPILILSWLYIYGHMSALINAICWVVYAFLFRPIMDFKRLEALGLMNKSEFKKAFGFYRFRFYRSLMFGPKSQ